MSEVILYALTLIALARVASRIGELIDKITPQNHAKMGGSMMVGHSSMQDPPV